MSYHLDRRNKNRKYFWAVFFVFLLLAIFYFRSSVFNKFSYGSHFIFRPLLVVGNAVGNKFNNLSLFFQSETSLQNKIDSLTEELNTNQAKLANYNSVLSENITLKGILGRKPENRSTLLASILSKPNQSPYDTIILDVGSRQGAVKGNRVFAYGDVPIGYIAEAYLNSSKVILYSNSGEKTEVIVGKNIFMQIVGRGGGNFEIVTPLDSNLSAGDEVILPGITPHVVAIVKDIISDPRDSFRKALLVAPVNIQELKFVEVEK